MRKEIENRRYEIEMQNNIKRIFLRDSHFEFHNFLYYLQLYKIYDLVLIGELSYRHAIDKFGKNLCLYLPMEA